jgi:hypothetical protein
MKTTQTRSRRLENPLAEHSDFLNQFIIPPTIVKMEIVESRTREDLDDRRETHG